MGVEVYVSDQCTLMGAVSNEVAEEFQSNFALIASLQGLITARAQPFDGTR
jgi:hypothetical protein